MILVKSIARFNKHLLRTRLLVVTTRAVEKVWIAEDSRDIVSLDPLKNVPLTYGKTASQSTLLAYCPRLYQGWALAPCRQECNFIPLPVFEEKLDC
jgi:hypothetical protein